jgi:hypothetical protein
MAGYTQPALDDLKDGQRLEVLLLTKEHVEAMLTGFCPPEELFEVMLDHAHFHGTPIRPLIDLVRERRERVLPVIGNDRLRPAAVATSEGVTATWLACDQIPFGQSGLTLFPDGRLLAVTGQGILEIDPASNSCHWVDSPTHVTDAKALPGGEIVIVRRYGVARLSDAGLHLLDGPFSGRVRFTLDCFENDEITIWSNDARGTGFSNQQWGALAYLGSEPGDARVRELSGPGFGGAAAARLSDDTTLILGNPSVLVDSAQGRSSVDFPISNPHTAGLLDDDAVLIAGGEVTVLRAGIGCRDARELITLDMRGSVVDMAIHRGTPAVIYVMASARDSQSMAIARVEFAK